MSRTQLVVDPVTPGDWDDVAAVFGTKGDPARCWCQWFRLRNPDWRERTREENREALHEQVTDPDGPPPGVLARLDGRPVGWCAVGPRPAYSRLAASTKVGATGESRDERADRRRWAVLCFVVQVGHRRQGISGALLDAAVALARAHGAVSLDAYPVDPAGRTSGKTAISSAELYHGVLTTFLAAGFTEVIRTGPARPIVRLSLTG
jgi:GNAT superfamily N-acetyltransferase